MAEQVVKMVIKVDLQCCRCYKKIKKILREIPHVKDQSFDEKQNKVTITVVCCRPEEVRQKICRKGRDFILGIDIIAPEKITKDESSKKTTKTDEDESSKTPTKTGEDESSKETKKTGATQDGPAKKLVPPPPMLGYPPVYVMGRLSVCPPCHNRGCGRFCPCNCHCGRPPMREDGCRRPADECRCGRPPMCHDGCGRPAHECRCRRPSYTRCCDRCNYGNASSSWTLHSCYCGRPLVCINAGYECESSCSHM